MSGEDPDGGGIQGWFGARWQRALESVVEDALKKLILLAAGVIFAAAAGGGLVLWNETHLSTWWRIGVIASGVAFLAGEAGVIIGTVRLAGRTRRLQLADVGELEDQLAQAAYGQEFVTGILNTLQEMMAAEEVFLYEQFAEGAVLDPTRVFLSRFPGEQVRISLLIPQEDGDSFRMKWAVGHRPMSRTKFELPMDGTLAGDAFKLAQTQYSPDVKSAAGYMPHPKATRPYSSLVCAPVKMGPRPAGVLCVVSTYTDAFGKGDIIFIELVSGVISFLLALEHDASRGEEPPAAAAP